MRKLFWYYIKGLFSKVDRHHGLLLASGLTFSIFTCIVPLILIAFAILGNVLEAATVKQRISSAIDQFIPLRESARLVREIVMERINELVQRRTLAGVIGGIGLLFAASGLFGSMRTILQEIFHVHDDSHLLMDKIKDVGLVIVVIIFIAVLVMIVPVIEFIRQFAWDLLPFLDYPLISSIILTFGSLIIFFIVFFALYYLVSYGKVDAGIAAVSAISAALLWELAKVLFGYYIKNAITLNQIYGAYVLIVAVAFWLYYSSLVFIVGAEIGQLYREREWWERDRGRLAPVDDNDELPGK